MCQCLWGDTHTHTSRRGRTDGEVSITQKMFFYSNSTHSNLKNYRLSAKEVKYFKWERNDACC